VNFAPGSAPGPAIPVRPVLAGAAGRAAYRVEAGEVGAPAAGHGEAVEAPARTYTPMWPTDDPVSVKLAPALAAEQAERAALLAAAEEED
jgi:hypothetical protein